MSKKIILLALMLPGLTLAADHMIVIGGGGEPNKPTTIFDLELANATKFVKRSKWQTRISFNGGHSQTEKIAQDFASKSSGANSNFTPQNYEALISEYERKIQNGSIKSGDQIVLMISSHGGQNSANEKTHIISTSASKKGNMSDFGTLAGSGAPPVSLDRLEKLTKLAKAKGIQLGILDFSCHSGITQKLANENTCIISSTGPNHFAWGGAPQTFASRFTQNMAPGKSLEDVFLEAIKDKSETSFPMISSPIGNTIQEVMYPLITPYLFDTRSNVTADKLKDFYIKSYAEDRCENLDSDYKDLINFTYDIENIAEQANYNILRSLLDQYKKLQAGIIQNVKLMNSRFNLSSKENFCHTIGVLRSCVKFSLQEVLNTDIDRTIDFHRRQLSSNPQEKKAIELRLGMYEKVKVRKDQLLRDQSIRTAQNFWDNSQHLKNTQQLAERISNEADNAFHTTYTTLRKEEGTSGPCAKIKF